MKIPKLPKGEILWETYMSSGKPHYIVTSTNARDMYFAYEIAGDKLKKLGKARTPTELKKYMKGV